MSLSSEVSSLGLNNKKCRTGTPMQCFMCVLLSCLSAKKHPLAMLSLYSILAWFVKCKLQMFRNLISVRLTE